MSHSDDLRKHWWSLSSNVRKLFKILYETPNGVPSQKLQEKFFTTATGITSMIMWIGRSIEEVGGPRSSGSDFISGGLGSNYNLHPLVRPVVGELLGHHKKEKTILLESLWNMAGMVKHLETRVGDIPGDISADLAMEFKSCQQELERLSQELLKPANA